LRNTTKQPIDEGHSVVVRNMKVTWVKLKEAICAHNYLLVIALGFAADSGQKI
jgi:hypothetical protein